MQLAKQLINYHFLINNSTEELIREMLTETSPNVEIRFGHTVSGLVGGNGKLTGVKVRGPDGKESTIDAAFVIDSTGPAVHSTSTGLLFLSC